MFRSTALLALVTLAAAIVTAGCGSTANASFDPTGACTGDGQAPGAYPDLEARIPTIFEDQPPGTLDSGRHCTPESLGSLADAGIDELRFAGGTWSFGGNRAAALVVFEGRGVSAQAIADFYLASATTADRTQVTGTDTPTLAGRPGFRLDTKTGERLQTVMTWPSADPDRVNVVITNDLPDPKIDAAIDAFEGG
jgi:hypothetical protein